MTDYLFAMPSVISGVASCIDLFGVYNLYNDSSTGEKADKRAFLSDILTLRNDMKEAVNEVLNVKA